MTRPFRILGAGAGGNNSSVASTSPTSIDHDSDFAIILAALLCGLICVLGLLTVFRCACFRSSTSTSPPPPPKAANKGLKKKILRSLPKLTFTPESPSSPSSGTTATTEASDCAICLAEFVAGDEIRVLPQCKHSFHVACIDSWLKSHSTCPSCRRIIVAGDQEVEKSAKDRANRDVGDFLP